MESLKIDDRGKLSLAPVVEGGDDDSRNPPLSDEGFGAPGAVDSPPDAPGAPSLCLPASLMLTRPTSCGTAYRYGGGRECLPSDVPVERFFSLCLFPLPSS